jgi:hypothetical protein
MKVRALALGGIEPIIEPPKPKRKKQRRPKAKTFVQTWPIMNTGCVTASAHLGPSSYNTTLAGLGPATATISGTWSPNAPQLGYPSLMASTLRQRVNTAKLAWQAEHHRDAARVILGKAEAEQLEIILKSDLGYLYPAAGYAGMALSMCGLAVVFDDAESMLEIWGDGE